MWAAGSSICCSWWPWWSSSSTCSPAAGPSSDPAAGRRTPGGAAWRRRDGEAFVAAEVNDPMHYAHVEHTGAASDRSPRPAVVHAGSLALVALLASPAVGAALPARAQDPSVSFASSPFDLDLDERAAAAVDPPPAAASAAAEASE